jgi:hypothetical protein
MIANGQMRGAFVQGIAAALYENSSTTCRPFLTGTSRTIWCRRYEIPVECCTRNGSPLTPLGAKAGRGNCMAFRPSRRTPTHSA